MLVIRRKEGQAIQIGDWIRIEVLESTPNRVKLGIVAPSDVRVVREEILLAEAENRHAACPPTETLALWARRLGASSQPQQPGPDSAAETAIGQNRSASAGDLPEDPAG